MVSFADGQALERALNPPPSLDKDTKVDVEEHAAPDTPRQTNNNESTELLKAEETTLGLDTPSSPKERLEASSVPDDSAKATSDINTVNDTKTPVPQPEPPVTSMDIPENATGASSIEVSISPEIADTQVSPPVTEANNESRATKAVETSAIPEVVSDIPDTSEPLVRFEDESNPVTAEQPPAASEPASDSIPGESRVLESEDVKQQQFPANIAALSSGPLQQNADLDIPNADELGAKDATVVAMAVPDEPQIAQEEQAGHTSSDSGVVTEPSEEFNDSTKAGSNLAAGLITESHSTESNVTLVDSTTKDAGQLDDEKPTEPIQFKESTETYPEPVEDEFLSAHNEELVTSAQPEIAAGEKLNHEVVDVAKTAPIDAPTKVEELASEPVSSPSQVEPLSVADDSAMPKPAETEPTVPETAADRTSDTLVAATHLQDKDGKVQSAVPSNPQTPTNTDKEESQDNQATSSAIYHAQPLDYEKGVDLQAPVIGEAPSASDVDTTQGLGINEDNEEREPTGKEDHADESSTLLVHPAVEEIDVVQDPSEKSEPVSISVQETQSPQDVVTKVEESTEAPVLTEKSSPIETISTVNSEPSKSVETAPVTTTETQEPVNVPTIEPDLVSQQPSDKPVSTHADDPFEESNLDKVSSQVVEEGGGLEADATPAPIQVDDSVLMVGTHTAETEVHSANEGNVTPEVQHLAVEPTPDTSVEANPSTDAETVVQEVPAAEEAIPIIIEPEQSEAINPETEGESLSSSVPALNIPDPEEAPKADEVERPTSPWTPSYSVTTHGPGTAQERESIAVATDEEPAVTAVQLDTESTAKDNASEEEMRKSPSWTPSYSVSRQGSPMIPATELAPAEENVEESSKEISESAIALPRTEEPETRHTEEQTPADEDKLGDSQHEATAPILKLPADEPIAQSFESVTDAPQASAGWTPSYSISRQGSPSVAPKELASETDNVVPNEEAAPVVSPDGPAFAQPTGDSIKEGPVNSIWTQSYSVDVQGSPHTPPSTLNPEGEPDSQVTTSSGVSETGPTAGPGTDVLTPTPESESSAITTSTQPERPLSPWTPSYSVTLQAPGEESETTVEEKLPETPVADSKTPVLQLPASDDEPSQLANPPPERPSSPWTPSYSVTTQPPIEVADTAEIPVVAPIPVSVSAAPPVEVNQLSNPEATEAPRSWTPSYSVSNQGTPVVEKQELPDTQHERILTDDTKVNPEADEDHETAKAEEGDFKPGEHSLVALVHNELEEQKVVPPETTTVYLSSVLDEAPRPASPWAPSYSVSRQGSPRLPEPESATPADTESTKDSQITEVGTKAVNVEEPTQLQGQTESIEVPKSPWTPSYSVSHQGASRDEGLDKLEQLPDLVKSNETFPTTDKNRPSLQLETAAHPNGEGDHYSRTRLESTASSRFFPGGWYTSTPKSPEGRPSLDTAQGEITPAKPFAEEGKRKSRRCHIM